MKRIYTFFTVLAATALCMISCQTVPDDNSHVEEVVAAPAVTISVSAITDYTATINVAPDGAANYYAYLVDQSEEPAELDAATLYANQYSSLKNGLVKYATSGSTTVELEDLEPNTTYQVYAVAGSTTGVVGTVAVKSFLTTDKGTPTPGTPTKKENVLAVAFSEDVTYDATKPATAYYYAYNTAIIDKTDPENPELVFDGKVGEAKVDVAVDGATATFTVTLDGTNPLPAGAYYTVGYPAGAFVDAVGNPCPIRTHLTGVTQKGNLGFAGFYGRVSTKAFDLVDDAEKTVVTPAENYLTYGIPEDVTIYKAEDAAKATMTVTKTSANRKSVVDYGLTYGVEWGLISATQLVLYFPDDIDILGGDDLSVEIAEGSFTDIYGNSNAALAHEYLYSFNYNMEDILGTYNFVGEANYAGPQADNGVVIAPDTDPGAAKTDVVIYNLFANTTTCDDLASFTPDDPTVLYGSVDLDRGTLTVQYGPIGTAEDASYEIPAGTYVVPAANGEEGWENFECVISNAGSISFAEPVYVVLWGLGYWDAYTEGTLTRTSKDYTAPEMPAAAPASVKEQLGTFTLRKSLR